MGLVSSRNRHYRMNNGGIPNKKVNNSQPLAPKAPLAKCHWRRRRQSPIVIGGNRQPLIIGIGDYIIIGHNFAIGSPELTSAGQPKAN